MGVRLFRIGQKCQRTPPEESEGARHPQEPQGCQWPQAVSSPMRCQSVPARPGPNMSQALSARPRMNRWGKEAVQRR
eukprot:1151818-Alexandrium_andersonii.AAC.1